MKSNLATLLVAMACTCATVAGPLPTAAPAEIAGTWELIDICAFTLMESPPRGVAARKYHFTEDGRLYVMSSGNELSDETPSVPYRFADGVLMLDIPDQGELEIPTEFRTPGIVTLVYGERNRWTLRRIEAENPLDQATEPRSVAVLQTRDPEDQLSNLDIRYDTEDYSHMPQPARIIGVWEATSYSGVPATECPPYGFPNNKWVFTGTGKHFILAPSETSQNQVERVDYEVSNHTLTVFAPGDEKTSFTLSFNTWGHLVISSDGITITFKLLDKDPSEIQELPTKIALLNLEGQ